MATVTRLRAWIAALLPGVAGPATEPGSDTTEPNSIHYEVLRMSHQGGWQHYDGAYEIADALPEPFEIHDEGRYRAVKRVNGQLRETIWTHETPRAQKHYNNIRRLEQIEDHLNALSDDDEHKTRDRDGFADDHAARPSLAELNLKTQFVESLEADEIPEETVDALGEAVFDISLDED